MVLVQGYSVGAYALIGQLIVPFQQFPLTQAVLGINNWQTGIVYNEAHLAQPVPCSLHSFTVTAYGAAPSAGSLTLTAMAAGANKFSVTLDASTITVAAAAPQQIYLAPTPLPTIPAGVDLTVVGDATGYVQTSGGLCIALWGLAVG